jgi:hypothetical protein
LVSPFLPEKSLPVVTTFPEPVVTPALVSPPISLFNALDN